MIFIANYWMDPNDTIVTIYTNCEQVELRLNDRLIRNGGKHIDQESSYLLRPPFVFKVDTFIPGRLEAIGRINGLSVARMLRSTPSSSHHHLKIELDLSGKVLTFNDIVFVYVYVCDQNNIVIPDANDLIHYTLIDADPHILLIGANPVHAEAGIASILLKTDVNMSNNHVTIQASSSTVEQQHVHLSVEILNR
jgi:beta-galactosidase